MPSRLPQILLFLALLPACGGGAGSADAILRLANAPIVAGDRFGPLQLGETTLRSVVDDFGAGQIAATATDTTQFELTYVAGQLRLVFDLGAVLDEPLSPAVLRGALRDFPTFVASRAEIGSAKLSVVELRTRRSPGPVTIQGSFADGPALGGPASRLFAHLGLPIDGAAMPGDDFEGVRRFQFAGLSASVTFEGAGRSRIERITLFPSAE